MEKLTEFDMAEYLGTEELREGYLDFISKEGTPEELLQAISIVARARGMVKTAKDVGTTSERLCNALSLEENPSFTTVCRIVNAIGYTLTPVPIAKNAQV